MILIQTDIDRERGIKEPTLLAFLNARRSLLQLAKVTLSLCWTLRVSIAWERENATYTILIESLFYCAHQLRDCLKLPSP